jgi:thiosulfate dehydrogenase
MRHHQSPSRLRPAARLSLLALAAASGLLLSSVVRAADEITIDLKDWKVGDISNLPDDEYGRAVRYGHQLTTETYRFIGPEAADPAKRYAGNNLACQSCHQDAATKPYAMPWIGVSATFPQYRARENDLQSVEDRVNGCMERSMAGKPLPLDSKEMRAFSAYIHFLSRGIPVGAKVVGAGTKAIDPPNRKADPVRGEKVYAEACASCHQPGGLGQRAGAVGDAKGYDFPPVGGLDSFNNGAGMFRLLTAYQFIYHNMPQGTSYQAPTLSKDDAFDVAAYIETLPRQAKANLDKDFPNRLRKPADMPHAPWVGSFDAEAHKFGPFQPIQAELKDLQAAARAKRAAEEAAKAAAQPKP